MPHVKYTAESTMPEYVFDKKVKRATKNAAAKTNKDKLRPSG
jgi:hypothetical protein